MSGHVLAIDTSTPLGSVAIGRDGALVCETAVGARARNVEMLLPSIDGALKAAGIGPRSLDSIVVGGGPGSFTGVRIAGATAKGLVAVLGVPLYAYSGLLALAAGLGSESRPVCALLDARRGQVYAACYRFPEYARIETLLEPDVRPIEEVLRALDGVDPVYAGGGALRYRDAIEAVGAPVAPPHLASPRAAALLWLAELAADGGRVADPDAWEPRYLRASGAERRVRG